MFIKNKRIMPFILVLAATLLLFSLSSVSAESFNTGNTSADIQNFIDTGLGDDEIVLEEGDYIDTLYNLNVSRKVNIKSNGQVNIKSINGGTLFNVAAKEVQILNLNISGYQTAIRSNIGDLSVVGNNITTSDVSILISGGGDLSGISLENNTIISSVSSNVVGAVYVNANIGSTVGISAKNNNITGTSNGVYLSASSSNNTITLTNNNITGNSGTAVFLNAVGSNNTINFTNNNITGTPGYGVYLYLYDSNNTITLTNNNITGTSDGVQLAIRSSNNTITLTNNNITGTSMFGVYLYADTSNNTINLTNNNITGAWYGVVIPASSSNNTITLNNNNITGTSGYGVELTASRSNNTINFTNNNITGASDGVNMPASNSNNTITFTNNNITGNSGYGVNMPASSSNNTINFTNNNITGALGRGVDLSAPRSNNTITFTNNNITGTGYGVDMYADSSNNTITLTNNNITGTEGYGVALSVESSNNIINFINNNITGTSKIGVYLRADSSKNTVLSFIGNNITCIGPAMHIYSYNGFSGLSLLNNTFKSDDVGLYFVLDGAVLSDILVRGNTIFAVNTGIGFKEYSPSSVNLTVNYNRIIADVGLDFTATDDGSNFDYNWWGVNDISGKIFGFDTNNHYILNITNLTSLANVSVGDDLDFALLVLNTTLTNVGVENLPYFVITGTLNGETYNTTTDDLFVHQFTVPGGGIQTIDAFLDDQYVFLKFNASKINTTSTIVVPANARTSKTINITGVASDDIGNPLANTQLTVIVDGVAYNVTTDIDGNWTLAYKPVRVGSINVSVSWAGNSTHNGFTRDSSFNVVKGNITVIITVTENPDGSVTILANATDEDGDPVEDHHVDFFVDDELVGTGVTDEDGIVSITIPGVDIGGGNHNVTVNVTGGENHNNGTGSGNITLIFDTNSTIVVPDNSSTGKDPVKPDIRFIKRVNKKSIKNGKKVIVKYLIYKNFGGSGSQILSAQVLFKNFKYKVLNKIKLQYAKNKVKFKVNLKSGGTFTLKIKTYRPIKAKT